MADTKHTPLPWKLFPEDTPTETRDNFFYVLRVVGADEKHVAIITGGSHARASEEERANAALIVQCCNAYPALVEALKKIKSELDSVNDYDSPSVENVCLAVAENALRAAGEEL